MFNSILCRSGRPSSRFTGSVRIQPRSWYSECDSRWYIIYLTYPQTKGLPDKGYFGRNSEITHTPLRAVWLVVTVSILPGLLDLASPVAANAIFSVAAMALDLSYIIPIFCRRIFHSHPDVMFKPGPFYMGDGWLGFLFNYICILWTLFVCVVFSIPTILPVTKLNMNYAAVSSCLLHIISRRIRRLLYLPFFSR